MFIFSAKNDIPFPHGGRKQTADIRATSFLVPATPTVVWVGHDFMTNVGTTLHFLGVV